MVKNRWLLSVVLALTVGLVAACGGGGSPGSETEGESAKSEPVTLKLTHQWPKPTKTDSGDYEGDFRAILAARFAEEVEKKSGGQVTVKIFPNNSLVGSQEQYDAMLQGAVDMSVFPLAYAGGKVPQFNATLMPTLVRSHKQAQNWQDAEVGSELTSIMEENGVKVVTWVWNAGAIGSKGDPIVAPDDIKKGMVMRAAGSRVEDMLARAGASITSMSSSEMYSAFQTGVLDAGVTSTGSFASYNLFEQVDSYVSPTKNTFWFMFEPLIISTDTWDKLSPEQQKAVEEAGAELQEYAYTASEEDDVRVEKLFQENGVEVVQMPDDAFEEWQEVAQPVIDDFSETVDGGEELIKLAQEVPAD